MNDRFISRTRKKRACSFRSDESACPRGSLFLEAIANEQATGGAKEPGLEHRVTCPEPSCFPLCHIRGLRPSSVPCGTFNLCVSHRGIMASPTPSTPIPVVTTPTLEGSRITRYLGVVAGETILGTGFGSDFIASLKDFTGDRVGEWERWIVEARYTALLELAQRAQAVGANAVVGASLDYEVMGQNGSIVLVAATGTAVVVEAARS